MRCAEESRADGKSTSRRGYRSANHPDDQVIDHPVMRRDRLLHWFERKRGNERRMSDVELPHGARDLAVATAREAGALLREMLGRVTIEFKGTVDLVTDADR